MGRLRETNGHDMDDFGNGAVKDIEKTPHSDATADDLSTLGNGDTGPITGDISTEGLVTEVITKAMGEEDELIFDALVETHKPTLTLATNWLKLISCKLDDAHFDAALDTVPKGLRLSTPALLAYIRHITEGKKVNGRLSIMLEETEGRIRSRLLLPFEIDQTEAAVVREAGTSES